MMRQGGLAERYVKAIVGLDLKGLTLKQLQAELAEFNRLHQESPDLRQLLENPAFTLQQRKAVVQIIKEHLGTSDVCRDVLFLLCDKHRVGLLPEIAQGLERHIDAKAGVVQAKVGTAVRLTAEQTTRLTQVLSTLRGGPVKVSTRVDPALIGGVVVEMEGVVYDGSIGRRLSIIRERTPREAE